MKRFTEISENFSQTLDTNPGNAMTLGVTNHLTPVDNIVTNVRNYFASVLGIVVCVAEDGVSLKMHSHTFVSKHEIEKTIYNPIFRGLSVADYIKQQGLDFIKMISLGQYWVVYFCPSDISNTVAAQTVANNTKDKEGEKKNTKQVKEQVEYNIEEAEMDTFIKEDDDEELKDITKKKLSEIITSKDKVKAAKQLELLVAQEMELPREYYFAGVKSKDGDESIALRWKYTMRRPHNRTSEAVRSLINIFGEGKDAIWVADFDEKSYFQLPDEVKKLIENILEFLGAEETNDKCIYKIKDSDDDDSSSKDDDKGKDNGDENKDNGDENKDKGDEGKEKKDDDLGGDDLLG